MSKAWGFDFVMVNDVQQVLDPKVFRNGPWLHLATVRRGFKEYMAFRRANENQVYMEEVDPKEPGLLKRISDDKEWAALYHFLKAADVFRVNGDRKIAK